MKVNLVAEEISKVHGRCDFCDWFENISTTATHCVRLNHNGPVQYNTYFCEFLLCEKCFGTLFEGMLDEKDL